MIRFEELQMRLMDAAKNYLEVYDMSTLVEQYSLNKESRLSMTLPEIKPPYPITATVSFLYDVQQSSSSIYFEDSEEETEEIIELDVVINLPFVEGYNEIADLYDEILNEYSELEPVLVKKEFYRRNLIDAEEYEIIYSYVLGIEELKDLQFYEEVFFELSNILRLIYEKTKFYIDMSWYREQDYDSF